MLIIAILLSVVFIIWFIYEIKNAPIVDPYSCDKEEVRLYGCEGVCQENPPCIRENENG